MYLIERKHEILCFIKRVLILDIPNTVYDHVRIL